MIQFQPDFSIRTAEQDEMGRAEPASRIIDPEQARHEAKRGNTLRTKQAIALLISKSAWLKDSTTPYRQTRPFVPVIRKGSYTWRQEFLDMIPSPTNRRTGPIYNRDAMGDVVNSVLKNIGKRVIPTGPYINPDYLEALTVAEQAHDVAQSYGARATVVEDEAGQKYVANNLERNAVIAAHEQRRAEFNEQLN